MGDSQVGLAYAELGPWDVCVRDVAVFAVDQAAASTGRPLAMLA